MLLSRGSISLTDPVDVTTYLLLYQSTYLPDHEWLVLYDIGNRLSPVNFQGRLPRLVSYYALFKGWLLLSQPPNCIRKTTPFKFTLSLYFRALIIVWVVSLSELRLTPSPLLWTSTIIIDSEFDKKGGNFSPVLSNQYLYPIINLHPG